MMSKTIEPLSVKHNLLWNTIGCLFYLGCQWLTTILVVTLTGDYANSGLLAYAMACLLYTSRVRSAHKKDTNQQDALPAGEGDVCPS